MNKTMRVMYVAPRYHTNQVPIVRGWLENDHRVCFVSQIASEGEDHRDIEPVLLGFSPVFSFFFGLSNRLNRRTDPDEQFAIYSKKGFPPIGRLKNLIKSFSPDVVIVRERSMYSICTHLLCKSMGILVILYNQSPLWDKPSENKGVLWKLVRLLSPKYRMTVSEGRVGEGNVKTPNSYFVPFVMEVEEGIENRNYVKEGIIRLLCVARYAPWKNHYIVLDAVRELHKKYDSLELVIAGSMESDAEVQYYKELVSYVADNDLSGFVRLRCNLSHEDVMDLYRESDVFLLPSNDPNSVSELEAMSFGLPVICTDLPGKASYVKNGENGYLVSLGDSKIFTDRLEEFFLDPGKIAIMGKKSLEMVRNKFSFENYYESVCRIIQDMKNSC